jgi:predicted house-cleaning noncanonical NTP pyrophosphatase (MazG superfamily)
MLLRDKVGEELINAINKVKDSQVEVVKLIDNEDFLEAVISKIKSEIEILESTKSVDSLAEIVELIDWIQICFGTTKLNEVIEHRKDKLGLYWERYYIKENKEGKK